MSNATATQRRGIRLKPDPETVDPALVPLDQVQTAQEQADAAERSTRKGQAKAGPKPYARRIAEAHEIPAALRDLPYWVAWRLVQKPGKAKPDKIPISPRTGKSNWSIGAEFCTDFETARDYAERNGLQGVGFLLVEGCGVSGIDLDHCRDPQTGELSDLAQSVIDTADTYFEVSPGLSGVRGFFLGGFGGHIGNNHEKGVEFYEPNGNRFLTVTGDHIEETPFAIETRDLAKLGARHFSFKADKASTDPPMGGTGSVQSIDLDGLKLTAFTKRLIRTGDTSKYNGDRSAALYGAAKDLMKAGLDDESVAHVLCNPDHGISEKALSERSGDLASAIDWTRKYTVKSARADVEREQTAGKDSSKPQTNAPAHKPQCPDGFKLTSKMVFEVKEKEEGDEYVPICGPLWIIGRTTGTHGEWGLVLIFVDHDGRQQQLAIPAARLHEDASILSRELATMGLKTIPGREKKLLAYLASWDIETRILSAKRLGWLEDRTGALAFVMPDKVISGNGHREICYQPERFSPTVRTVHASASLADWQRTVAMPACQHPPMLFALCCGLAPAFLAFGEAGDSFILHFWGTTSRGKTTLGQIAASPWGCAADPSDAPSLTFVRRWNLTGNGLEGLAEAHSDLPLILDELGSSTVGDIRPLVYQISGGQGKAAMTSSREMREPRSWRTVAISTGEVSLRARMMDPKEDGRIKAVKGGLVHRALDVELTDIAEGSPLAERGEVVSSIKVSCARAYGTAGPELVRQIARRFDTIADARAYTRAQTDRVLAEIAPQGLPAETLRAVRRFALIATAGIFAAEQGLIPTTAAAVIDATKDVVSRWLGAASDTDEQRIIASVRDFILRHESRFQPINEPEPAPKEDRYGNVYQPGRRESEPVRDRVGFVDRATDRWLFTDAGLTEAAPGHDRTTIARALKAAGLLHTAEGKLQVRTRIGGSRPRMYAVEAAILDGTDSEKSQEHQKTGGPGGPGGPAQQPQGFEPVHLAKTRGGPGGPPRVDQSAPAHRKNKASEIFQAPDSASDAEMEVVYV
ncbi:MAG: DUF927 domain-containing protein [Chromatiaceae bacterium]|nr:DUF927 domain-containing protein [Chromatiaceae bacterium]MCF7993845.1 DUF927 domain-containing protein [Chromatiaceae bacterium]MCF8003865.1 DUF927 domain-containing protein [Chromatiaceae bacterium]MCF8017487.1 DUF927 domain-containing protein [Chromatiaceae bacterium]